MLPRPLQNSRFLTRKSLLLSIKVIIAVVIIGLLARYSQLNLSLMYSFIEYPFSSLVIVGLCYVMVILHAWRWYRLNSVQGINLSFQQTIMPTYLGVAFNTVLPGSVGGDFVRLYYVIRRFSAQKTKAAFAILVDRLSGLLGIFTIGCIVAPYYMHTYNDNATLKQIVYICSAVSIGVIVGFGFLMLLSAERIGFLHWTMKISQRYTFLRPFVPFLEAIVMYKNAKWVVIESLIVSIATQLLLLIVLIIISKMMSLPLIPAVDYMLAMVVGQVANLIPVTPGGVGIGEAAFSNTITLIHPGTVSAYATIFFAVRLISALAYFPGILIGVFSNHLYAGVRNESSEIPLNV